MSREPSRLFARMFDSGTRKRANNHAVEEARLVAKAEAITACAALAKVYEDKNANAGTVRLILSQRADEAWDRVEAHHHTPLGAEATADAGETNPPLASTSRESHPRLTASAPSGNGEPTEHAEGTAASSGAPRPRLTAQNSGSSPSPLDSRLETIRRTVDLVLAQIVRLVDSNIAITPIHAAELADLLETVSALCSAGELIGPTPQSLRSVDPPTLRVV